MTPGWRDWLRANRLWVEPERAVGPNAGLAELCAQRALLGGLSIAPDLRPEELLGPLGALLGGAASRLKVLDVRDRPAPTLEAAYGDRTVTWEVPDWEALVDALNATFVGDARVKAAVRLGEWEDLRQLWCVPKASIPVLLEEAPFRPENRAQLEAMVLRLERGGDADG